MLADVVGAIAESWDDVMGHLSRADREAAAGYAREILRSDDEASRFAAAQHLVDLAAPALPAGHPVRRALATEASKFVSAAQSWAAANGLLAQITRADLPPEVLGGRGGGSPAPRGQPAPGTEEIRQGAEAWLLSAPALAEEEVLRQGVDPKDRGLIRLSPSGAAARLPAFQFDPNGHPYPVVMLINRILDAAGDPWGVADWWLGPNAWIDAVPAESIGQITDGVLIAAARAVFEGA
jgi:hypothetical protein